MSIVNSLESQEVFITHQMPTGTTFGIRVDNNENVFINAKLAKKHAITEEEVRTLILIPNANNNLDTPWQAVGISAIDISHFEKPTPRVNTIDLEDRIVKYFREDENMHAIDAEKLAEALDVDVISMQKTLKYMHTAGEIKRAEVHCESGQHAPDWVLWSPHTEWFELRVDTSAVDGYRD
tara:strand:+ start:298 stop:837 length:540 start_codon:yes stop_codon:yes gene_type:complete